MTLRARYILFGALALLYIGLVMAANYVTTELGLVSVGFGLVATAGTYFAGLTFVVRDSVQDAVRPLLVRQRVVTKVVREEKYPGSPAPQLRGLMVNRNRQVLETTYPSRWLVAFATSPIVLIGALLSFLVSDPFIALASGVAFLVAELADLAVYTPLREKGYIRAAVASNVVGTVLDTFLFLWIAGFPIAGAWQGQVVGKLTVTGIAVLAVLVVRRVRKARA